MDSVQVCAFQWSQLSGAFPLCDNCGVARYHDKTMGGTAEPARARSGDAALGDCNRGPAVAPPPRALAHLGRLLALACRKRARDARRLLLRRRERLAQPRGLLRPLLARVLRGIQIRLGRHEDRVRRVARALDRLQVLGAARCFVLFLSVVF